MEGWVSGVLGCVFLGCVFFLLFFRGFGFRVSLRFIMLV